MIIDEPFAWPLYSYLHNIILLILCVNTMIHSGDNNVMKHEDNI